MGDASLQPAAGTINPGGASLVSRRRDYRRQMVVMSCSGHCGMHFNCSFRLSQVWDPRGRNMNGNGHWLVAGAAVAALHILNSFAGR